MKQFLLGFAAIASATLLMLSPSSAGQGEPSVHPLVGTWRASDMEGVGLFYTFHGDGTGLALLHDGTAYLTYVGVWETTGPGAARFTFETMNPDGSGMGFSGAAEVAETDDRWVVPEGEVARVTVDQIPLGQIATPRSSVLPAGTPIGR